MAECEHLARTSAYFDGELPDAEHAAALAHLPECADCRSLLGAAVSLEAAVSNATRAAQVSGLGGRGWWLVGAGVAFAAAAAIAVWLARRPEPTPQIALELPRERAIESRFSGALFAPYRPRAVMRGTAPPHEAIALATLAELEKRGDQRDLVAALASSGNTARAEELAAALPPGDATEADRAALALVAGDAERALAHAYAGGDAAAWNLGLAARDLGLPHVAAQAFERVAKAGEPGWSADARTLAAADPWLPRESGFTAFRGEVATMLAGGASIDPARIADYPAYARVALYDALRVAKTRDDVARLQPLARALDAASNTATAMTAVDRVATSDFAVRARFIDDYQALVARTLPADRTVALVDHLAAGGAPVADLYLGAAILASQAGARLDALTAIVGPWHDPWFALVLERERIRARFPGADLRAEPALVHALEGCANPAWAMRCGSLEQDLAQLLFLTGRDDEAERHARAAVDVQLRAAMPMLVANARALLADIHRRRGRFALARAEFEEVVLAIGDGDPRLRRSVEIGRANVAFAMRDLVATRALLPPPVDACCPGSDTIGLATAVDLARLTGDAGDRERAAAWIRSAREQGDEALAAIGDARLDPTKVAALHERARMLPAMEGVRTYAYVTLIADAGTRRDWASVIALGLEEHPIALPVDDAPCVVVASSDDDRVTVAIRTAATRQGATGVLGATLVPPDLVSALGTCAGIAVDARPPLHGRHDLLPPQLPWWFAGDSQPIATAPPLGRRALQILDVRPPDPSLPSLPALATSHERFDATLTGADATPARVLAALGDATYAEVHAHGIVAAADTDAAYLALSPDPTGVFALRADAIRKAHFTGAPIVVLAACRAAQVSPLQRQRWSLPDAFLAAGARAVIAADAEIPDAQAQVVFDELHHRLAAGEPIAQALAAVRTAHADWASHLVLFR